jgi:hypothetical protein
MCVRVCVLVTHVTVQGPIYPTTVDQEQRVIHIPLLPTSDGLEAPCNYFI